MPKKVALFDFDGTIAASIHVGVSIFNKMARKHGFSEITSENIQTLRTKSARQVARELGIPRLKIPIVVNGLRKGLKARIPKVAIVGGMKPILFALKKNGCELGIVTSNSRANVRAFLKNNKLEIFDYICARGGIFYKANAIRKTIARHHLEYHEIIFVGDERRDVVAARKNLIAVVAVTWGANSREGLEEEQADFVVDTAEELSTILTDFSEMS